MKTDERKEKPYWAVSSFRVGSYSPSWEDIDTERKSWVIGVYECERTAYHVANYERNNQEDIRISEGHNSIIGTEVSKVYLNHTVSTSGITHDH